MDDRKTSISPPPTFLQELFGRDGGDIAPNVRTSAGVEEELVGPIPESFVVYCGNAQQTSEGFAMALRAMGSVASLSQCDVGLSAINPTRKDD